MRLRMPGIKGFPAQNFILQKKLENISSIKLTPNWKQNCWEYLIKLVDKDEKLQIL